MTRPPSTHSKGFTLVELLIVMAIVAVLALIGFVGANRFIESGRKVQAMAQFRDFNVGMTMFIADYQKPPIPGTKKGEGVDTVYGDPEIHNYENDYLISTLSGENKEYPYKGETFSAKDSNPRGEAYMIFPYAADNKKGVGKDGRLYDPWGRQVIMAVNSLNAPGQPLVKANKGTNDELLWTFTVGEYSDTKPKDQMFALWSFGKDGKKGKGGASKGAIVPFAGSDDVISW